MNQADDLRRELTRLALEVQTLQQRRQQLLDSRSASVGTADALARIEQAISQAEADANEAMALLQDMESEEPLIASSSSSSDSAVSSSAFGKRSLDAKDEPATKRLAMTVPSSLSDDQRNLALLLTLAKSSASEVEKFSGVNKDLYAEFMRQPFPKKPWTYAERAAFFRNSPSESKVLEYVFGPRRAEFRDNVAALKYCVMAGFPTCVRRLLDANVAANDPELIWDLINMALNFSREEVARVLVERATLPQSDVYTEAEWQAISIMMKAAQTNQVQLFLDLYKKFPSLRFSDRVSDEVRLLFVQFETDDYSEQEQQIRRDVRRQFIPLVPAGYRQDVANAIVQYLDFATEGGDLLRRLVEQNDAEVRILEETEEITVEGTLQEPDPALVRKVVRSMLERNHLFTMTRHLRDGVGIVCTTVRNFILYLESGILDAAFPYQAEVADVFEFGVRMQVWTSRGRPLVRQDPFWATLYGADGLLALSRQQLVDLFKLVVSKYCRS